MRELIALLMILRSLVDIKVDCMYNVCVLTI